MEQATNGIAKTPSVQSLQNGLKLCPAPDFLILDKNEDIPMTESTPPPPQIIQDVQEIESPLRRLSTETPETPKRNTSPRKREFNPKIDSETEVSNSHRTGNGRFSDPGWEEERRHYQKIVATFRRYSERDLAKLKQTSDYLNSLPKNHQKLLQDYKKHLKQVRRCVEENQNLCMLIIMEETRLFENQDEIYPSKSMKRSPPEPSQFDYDKVQAVFKQIVRDWSKDGEKERDSCYKPMVSEVERIFGDTKDEDGLSDIKILVPGAGLGRLAHDLVSKGYVVEGNEVSLFMLFASNFMLNKCSAPSLYKCYPWIHQTTNVLHSSDQIRPVLFPDITPCDLPPNSRFSMTAGDFLDVYGTPVHKSDWDCVVTCFFIDCANNIVAYLEKIFYCLREEGVWINMGPLLYHFADMPNEQSIEPPFDMLREIIKKIGFVIEKEETNVPTLYADNSESMLSYRYNSVFLVCRKRTESISDIAETLIEDSNSIKKLGDS